jgi:hypothetical protein
MSEQICDHCGKPNPENETYCFSCGQLLPAGRGAIATHKWENDQELKPQIRWGTAYFGDEMILRIHVRCTNDILQVVFKDECILGRVGDPEKSEIDLTPCKATEMGVSRRHAKLTRQHDTVMVQDLGSMNGTFLNGQKLLPHQPRVLRHEDELSLGHLALRVSFARINKPEEADAPDKPQEIIVPPEQQQQGQGDSKPA